MLLIGSRAANWWHPKCKVREASDWDIVASHKEACDFTGQSLDPAKQTWKHGNIEFHNAEFFLNFQLESLYASDQGLVIHDTLRVWICNSRGLAAIKRSHLHRTIKFVHHMIQYQELDKDFTEQDWKYIRARTDAIKMVYPDRVGTKDKKNEDFFKDAIKRDLPHDEIHKIVAHYDEPLYLKLKVDKSMAAYDLGLWENLSLEDKHNAVREECYVIALERFLIPHRKRFPYRIAFHKALEKACTTLDNGPFREHAIDYWNEIRNFNGEVFDRFFNSQLWLTNGNIASKSD